jgi:hypothetical protein
MRKAFRNLAISEERFLHQLEKNHNKFFQTIMQNRRQLYFGKALEDSLNGMDDPCFKPRKKLYQGPQQALQQRR